jgi:hypothetical protein
MVIKTRSFTRLDRADIEALATEVECYTGYLGVHGEHRHEGDPLSP